MRSYKNICITNRHLVQGDFLDQMNFVCGMKENVSAKPDLVILREKDLTETEYENLAKAMVRIADDHQVTLILHTFTDAAIKLGIRKIHVSMPKFLEMSKEEKAYFDTIGVSTHSVEEAVQAEKLGASYVTASHIFPTDCKKGLAPRGLLYLRDAVAAVDIPVYALGGIHEGQINMCIEAGAAGVCMMSEYMRMREITNREDEEAIWNS